MGTAITEEPIDMNREIWDNNEIRDSLVNMFGKRPREEDDEGDNSNSGEDQHQETRPPVKRPRVEDRGKTKDVMQAQVNQQRKAHKRMKAIRTKLLVLWEDTVSSLDEDARNVLEDTRQVWKRTSTWFEEAFALAAREETWVKSANQHLAEAGDDALDRAITMLATALVKNSQAFRPVFGEVEGLASDVFERCDAIEAVWREGAAQTAAASRAKKSARAKKSRTAAERKSKTQEMKRDKAEEARKKQEDRAKRQRREEEQTKRLEEDAKRQEAFELERKQQLAARRERQALEDEERKREEAAARKQREEAKKNKNTRPQNKKPVPLFKFSPSLLRKVIPLFEGVKKDLGTVPQTSEQVNRNKRPQSPAKVTAYSAGKAAKERSVDCRVSRGVMYRRAYTERWLSFYRIKKRRRVWQSLSRAVISTACPVIQVCTQEAATSTVAHDKSGIISPRRARANSCKASWCCTCLPLQGIARPWISQPRLQRWRRFPPL